MSIKKTEFALFNLGFRIFFLGAGLFSIIALSLWMAIYQLRISLFAQRISTFQWHSHEMIFGYSIAVVAGFLLTAAKLWTGRQMPHGKPLMLIFALWVIARLLFTLGTAYLFVAGIFDILFLLSLLFAVGYPIVKVKQWRQLPILSMLVLFIVCDLLFYLGAYGLIDNGFFWGIYGGLYLIVGLILIMGRRVLPAFITSGVGYPVTLTYSKWLDSANQFLFLAFLLTELILRNQMLSSYVALALFGVNAARLIGWHTPGIWKKSLLWSMYLPFWFITFGFLLSAGVYFVGISKFLAIHAFAVGGIGVLTLSMMARVSLGHTGRSFRNPPPAISYAFVLLLLGAVVRVIVPLFDTGHYTLWIGLSQTLWILSFAIFIIIYSPFLVKPRIDGKSG